MFEPSGVVLRGLPKANLNQIDLRFWSLYSGLRFFLKRMQGIDAPVEPNCVHKAICFTCKVVNNLQDTCATKSSQRFGVDVLSALLSYVERKTDRVFYFFGECREIPS